MLRPECSGTEHFFFRYPTPLSGLGCEGLVKLYLRQKRLDRGRPDEDHFCRRETMPPFRFCVPCLQTDRTITENMSKASAGLLMYRKRNQQLEVLLVHLGGPFWARKDAGAWFVPKGEINPGEDELAAAKREFQEETGLSAGVPLLPLGSVQHKSGKRVSAWAFEGDCDPAALRSNTFQMEWPPRSGKTREFLEIDRAAFFTTEAAREKMHPAEFEFVTRLVSLL
jgi:predicted NUDIX family NTP pyrophosphohydrolase